MAHSSCSISGFFEPSRSLASVFSSSSLKQDDTDIFGNSTLSAFSAVLSTVEPLISTYASAVSISGVFKYQEALGSDFSCIPETVSTGEDHCGTLIFSQACSSAHIVTMGL